MTVASASGLLMTTASFHECDQAFVHDCGVC